MLGGRRSGLLQTAVGLAFGFAVFRLLAFSAQAITFPELLPT